MRSVQTALPLSGPMYQTGNGYPIKYPILKRVSIACLGNRFASQFGNAFQFGMLTSEYFMSTNQLNAPCKLYFIGFSSKKTYSDWVISKSTVALDISKTGYPNRNQMPNQEANFFPRRAMDT